MRLRLLLPLAILGGALLLLHRSFPLPYVYRVLVYRDSDFEDIHRFPANPIAAPETALELPRGEGRAATAALESHPEVSDLETLLESTDTTAFLLLHRGRLVVERYLGGHDVASMQNGFSVSKSVLSALVGLAIRDGFLELDTPLTRDLPQLAGRDPRFGDIRVESLLGMTSGIRYSDSTSFPFVNADDALIYYHPDLRSVLLERTSVETAPGEFEYNNYNPPLLGLMLRRSVGLSPSEYLERELWAKIGAAYPAGWSTDEHGIERMESGFHAAARDLSRFGLLYLEDGRAGGRRVLPEGWVLASTEFDESVELEEYDGRSWGYGLGWWIVPRPSGRSDFCAIGRYGQFVYVSPQFEAVFVRTGTGRGEWGDRDWTELFYGTAQRLEPR